MRSPGLVVSRLIALAVSMDEPPPTATNPSQSVPPANSAAARKLTSVGSTRAPLKTVGLSPAFCSDSAARPGIPVAATPSSVTISTRSRPSWAQSKPISSSAPTPNFSGGAPPVKTVSVRYSVMVPPYPGSPLLPSYFLSTDSSSLSGVEPLLLLLVRQSGEGRLLQIGVDGGHRVWAAERPLGQHHDHQVVGRRDQPGRAESAVPAVGAREAAFGDDRQAEPPGAALPERRARPRPPVAGSGEALLRRRQLAAGHRAHRVRRQHRVAAAQQHPRERPQVDDGRHQSAAAVPEGRRLRPLPFGRIRGLKPAVRPVPVARRPTGRV